MYGSWGYALRAGLVKDDIPADVPAAICRRIMIAQALYAAGALLCVISTYWSIAFILLVQLNYAVAPRFAGAHRSWARMKHPFSTRLHEPPATRKSESRVSQRPRSFDAVSTHKSSMAPAARSICSWITPRFAACASSLAFSSDSSSLASSRRANSTPQRRLSTLRSASRSAISNSATTLASPPSASAAPAAFCRAARFSARTRPGRRCLDFQFLRPLAPSGRGRGRHRRVLSRRVRFSEFHCSPFPLISCPDVFL